MRLTDYKGHQPWMPTTRCDRASSRQGPRRRQTHGDNHTRSTVHISGIAVYYAITLLR